MKDRITQTYFLEGIEYARKYTLSVPDVGDIVSLNTGAFLVISRRFDYSDNDGEYEGVILIIEKLSNNDPRLAMHVKG